MGKEKRPFSCHQNFVLNWLSAPARGYIHNGETWKKYIKSDFKAIFFKPATNGQSDKGFLLTSKFVPKGLYAIGPGLYTCIKSLKMCIKSDFKAIILKLATYGQREKAFLLSSKFCPQCVVCPCPGLYTCGKTWKNVYKIRLHRDCFKTCNKWAKW